MKNEDAEKLLPTSAVVAEGGLAAETCGLRRGGIASENIESTETSENW